uniref:Nuclease associated modular domain-containing protein n=1 Tax=Cyberlindnera suaveolens TaxID=907738 RepID=S5TFI3_9ASCO|nr:hypothetical protein H731WILSUA-C_044 [Cyberlindnera suaveolens]
MYLPNLNILQFASSSKDFKHSPETKVLLSEYAKNRIFTQETRDKLSKMFTKENNPFFGKEHSPDTKFIMSLKKQGINNPMFNKPKSQEFIAYMGSFKSGGNNINAKSVFVYDANTLILLNVFETKTACREKYSMTKATLNKYIKSGLSKDGKIFKEGK